MLTSVTGSVRGVWINCASLNLLMKFISEQKVCISCHLAATYISNKPYPDFRNRKYALAPIGERVVVTASQQLDHNSWNATVIIRVDNPDEPIALNIRQDSNTAYDFTLFVMTMVERGFLSEGDTLIYDNAAVHLSADVFVDLMDYLERHGITPLPLPTYSPELNPIERCFNIVKNFLRYERDPEVPLLCDILRGFAKITQEIIAKEYLCSANYFVDKPLLIPPPLRNIIT